MNHSANNFNTASAIKSQFLAEVEFGVPSKKCRNFGICRISPVGKYKMNHPGASLEKPKECACDKNKSCTALCSCRIEGIVSLFEDGKVEMCFLRSGIDDTDFTKHFGSGSFMVEEDYVFLGEEPVNVNFEIKKGTYSVVLNKTLIKVFF